VYGAGEKLSQNDSGPASDRKRLTRCVDQNLAHQIAIWTVLDLFIADFQRRISAISIAESVQRNVYGWLAGVRTVAFSTVASLNFISIRSDICWSARHRPACFEMGFKTVKRDFL
jgi:hypothetical protein